MSDVQRRTDSIEDSQETPKRKFFGKYALLANGILYGVTGEEEEADRLGKRAFGEGNYVVEQICP